MSKQQALTFHYFNLQSFLNECEENISIFEKMTTEAGYLLSQPNMQKELDTLQRR
ncbi:hypothetical protein DPMN_186638 [Dreissena polymorpha]|uniref:Uncharacterized protein n=1 Tax=Dreissena polymorpha TaxID=45954 RepID=A0A9D4DPF6_DREPO|nr:hypothetical protein DPMN_186638 [Dreissena polymorpha]